MQFCRVFISCSRHQAVSSLQFFLGHSVIAFFIIDLVVLTNDMFVAEAVAYLLLLAVGLLCAYEFCAVYVTAGASASELNSPSGFFFGVSAISLAINMLFICKILFNGKTSNFILLLVVSICHSLIGTWLTSLFFLHTLCTVSGFDVDEYVRRSYKFAYSDCVEVAPVSCSPDPPDPSELYMTKSSR